MGRIVALAVALGVAGCANHPAQRAHPLQADSGLAGLVPATTINAIDASVDPPVGWRRDKFETDAQHTHVAWVSPTDQTAYGVILMNLPIPVGPDIVLWAFLGHLRDIDSQANLLLKQTAPDLPGLRFVAESGKYKLRVNLTVRNWRAWAVYAGTIKDAPVNADELRLAELARDRTRVAIPASGTGE